MPAGKTRGAFLARGVLAASAIYGAAAAAPLVARALAQGEEDVEILDFALTLQQFESVLYAQAGDVLEGESRRLASELAAAEAEHVASLEDAIRGLGGSTAPAPIVDFGDLLTSERSFLRTARAVEDTAVSALNGAAPRLVSKELLGPLAAIVQVDARHAGAIGRRRGVDPAPRAFEQPLEPAQARAALERLNRR